METQTLIISMIVAAFILGAIGFIIFTFVIKPIKKARFRSKNKVKINEVVEWLSEAEQSGCTKEQSIQTLIDHGLNIKIIEAAINKFENGKKIYERKSKRKTKGIFKSKDNLTEDSSP